MTSTRSTWHPTESFARQSQTTKASFMGRFDVPNGPLRLLEPSFRNRQYTGTFLRGTFPELRAKHSNRQTVFFSSLGEQKSDKKLPSRTLGTTKIPTPPSAPPLQPNPLQQLTKATPKSLMRKAADLTVTAFKTIVMFLVKLPGNFFYYITHPTERKERLASLKQLARDEAHHYWVGTKLLWADIQTARNLVGRTLGGSALTRRERKQLLRTVTDLFRLVPFSMFILIPFMEFALPFALRIFPNLLPSTFQDSLKAEESMKRELQSRIAMTQFFQETLEQLAKEQKRKASKRKQELQEAGVDTAADDECTIDNQEDSAAKLLQFLENARNGEPVPPDVIIRYANYFHDDLTLDNMPRMQLVNLCKYMSIAPYGSDAFLRFQLRHKIRILREDDQRILWEGIGSLTKMELREACQERGMRSTGLSKDAYKRALQEWLDLSVNKNVPISLLIMSRTFFLREEMFERKTSEDTTSSKSLASLVDAISGLDKEVLNEVILEVATSQEKSSDPDIRKIKLEVLSKQNELIRQEQLDREAAVKRKELTAERDENEKSTSSSNEILHDTSHGSTEIGTGSGFAKEDKSWTDKGESKDDLEDDEERELSTEEMDAISHLVSDDPVSKERAELERIKAAMKGEEKYSNSHIEGKESSEFHPLVETSSMVAEPAQPGTISVVEDDEKAKETVASLDRQVDVESSQSTSFSNEEMSNSPTEDKVEDDEEPDDPIVARLKKRVESMVDKIEVQLSDVQVKIGDKLHFLDKDRDGILTREEMAEVLQQVLKREITFEEAMEIADEMDNNKDGFFTVDELIKWIDEHKLVRFVEEGRDADMDRIMENQSSDPQSKDDSAQSKAGNDSASPK